jgi:hypothetical protein
MSNTNTKTINAARSGHSNTQTATPSSARPATPWLKVLTVEEYESPDGKPARRWTQIGVAFPHKDGAGLNVELRCLPLNGRLVILPPDEDDGSTGR